MVKDNFSLQSNLYAKYRPVYPDNLYDLLIPLTNQQHMAWDCGTGNGQVAHRLADHFEKVYATDISEKQISNANIKPNIYYSIQPAEKTSFSNEQFDLITVAQAIHWFDLEKFYKEVKRTLKPKGVIAIIGYSLVRFDHKIDHVINEFHDTILGEYWDEHRMFIENHYKNLPFPFKEIPTTEFRYQRKWTLEDLTGYLSTWSALQHFITRNGVNPFPEITRKLEDVWGKNEYLMGETPLFLRYGRL